MSDISTQNWTLDYSTFTEGSTFKSGVYRRELGVYLCKIAYDQSYTSELWGDTWSWPGNGQFVYWGYVYLEAGKSYQFHVSGNKYNFLQVTDLVTNEKKTLLDGSWSQWSACTSSEYVPGMTGWYSIEARIQGYSAYYRGTNAGGYSSDGGKTWNLLYDSGDGSLLRTAGPALVIKASGRVADSKQVIDLSFASSDSPRTLAVVWGATRGGESTNAWANAQVIGTVAAGATTATYTMPDSWGTADNLVARFCFVPSETVQPEWSNTYYWHDLTAPALADVAADGSGGDTIRVTGKVESFTGDSCDVKVLVGASSDSLTEWTGATTTLTAAGDFTLSLCETDTASTRYIAPGTTYYVQVEATAKEQTARSEVLKVTTLAATKWRSSATSVSRKTVTFTGVLSDIGISSNGKAKVELWAGTEKDASKLEKVEELEVAPSTTSELTTYSIAHTFANVETTYYWQFRVTNAAAGGTTSTVAKYPTSVSSVKTQDLTTYTWKGGDAGAWDAEANWDPGDYVGDCLGYPQSTNATARFTVSAAVSLASSRSVKSIDISDANVNVTIKKGADATSTPTLTIGGPFALSGAGSSLAFDGFAVNSASTGSSSIGKDFTLSLTNGTSLAMASKATLTNDGGRLLLTESTSLSCYTYYMKNGSYTLLRDATFSMSGYVYWSNDGQTADTLRFEGSSPAFTITSWWNIFAPEKAGSVLNIYFDVPRSGYAAAPLQGGGSCSLGSEGATGKAYVNVEASRSVKLQDGQPSTPLISRSNTGVSTSVFTVGSLPNDKSAFTGFTNGSTAIGVDINITTGLILFIR